MAERSLRVEGEEYVPLDAVRQALDSYFAPHFLEKTITELEGRALFLPQFTAEGLEGFFGAVREGLVSYVVDPLDRLEDLFRRAQQVSQAGAPITKEARESAVRLREAFAAIHSLLEVFGVEDDALEVLTILTDEADYVANWLEILRHLRELASGMEKGITKFQKAMLKWEEDRRKGLDRLESEVETRVDKRMREETQDRVETLLRLIADQEEVPNKWANFDYLPPPLKTAIERDVLRV